MTPIISLSDYNALRTLIQRVADKQKSTEMAELTKELNKSKVVDDTLLGEDVVRLHSIVELEDIKLKKKMTLKIVLPEMANLSEHKISVFAPLSIALLGFREGNKVEWKMPGGVKELQILKVTYDGIGPE